METLAVRYIVISGIIAYGIYVAKTIIMRLKRRPNNEVI